MHEFVTYIESLVTSRVTCNHRSNMTVIPKHEQLNAMCDLIVKHVAVGQRQKATMQYLFSLAIQVVDTNSQFPLAGEQKLPRIGEQELAIKVWEDAARVAAARSTIARLRKELNEFFSMHSVGREEKIKVDIGPDGYRLSFKVNEPPPMREDRVKEFWSPFFLSGCATRLYYPEPTFFRDSSHTHFFNAKATALDRSALKYLRIKGKLLADFKFVPSQSVRAMLALFDFFQRNRTPLVASPVRATTKVMPEADEDLIFVGTPGEMPLVQTVEASSPMKTLANSISCELDAGAPFTYKVTPLEHSGAVDLKRHWALMTRRSHRFGGRSVVVFSGTHERAIEAMITYVTRQEDLKALVGHFRTREYFPQFFQVLFNVNIAYAETEPSIDAIGVETAVDLPS